MFAIAWLFRIIHHGRIRWQSYLMDNHRSKVWPCQILLELLFWLLKICDVLQQRLELLELHCTGCPWSGKNALPTSRTQIRRFHMNVYGSFDGTGSPDRNLDGQLTSLGAVEATTY